MMIVLRVSAHFAKALAIATDSYPDANIYLSSIIPRRLTSKLHTQANGKAAKVNNYMRDVPGLYPQVSYISNTDVFDSRKNDAKQTFASQDKQGILLSDIGKAKLIQHLVVKVKEIENRLIQGGRENFIKNTKELCAEIL